jgi:glutamate racemase
VRFVHGAQGIARRIAFLTDGQRFERSQPDLALFTADGPDVLALRPTLENFLLPRLEIL